MEALVEVGEGSRTWCIAISSTVDGGDAGLYRGKFDSFGILSGLMDFARQ